MKVQGEWSASVGSLLISCDGVDGWMEDMRTKVDPAIEVKVWYWVRQSSLSAHTFTKQNP